MPTLPLLPTLLLLLLMQLQMRRYGSLFNGPINTTPDNEFISPTCG